MNPSLLTGEWRSRLRAFEDVVQGRGIPVELVMQEGKTAELGLLVEDVPPSRIPLAVAVFDENRELTSVSELGVVSWE